MRINWARVLDVILMSVGSLLIGYASGEWLMSVGVFIVAIGIKE